MFINTVKQIFSEFVELHGFTFIENEFTSNQVVLKSTDFNILISYDEREDEIYIDFDLSTYMKLDKNYEGLQFPLYLNFEVIHQHTDIFSLDMYSCKNYTLEERVKIKFNIFKSFWSEFEKEKNYKDILSSILFEERIRLKDLNYQKNLKKIIIKAHDFFKSHEYGKVISLLTPHREFLSEYDKKILDYSMKKIKVP
ncbi:MAG: hypothetical protein ACK5C0_07610 [Candidatus Kapaibacterium sp.]|jgi:hypothetical protein